MDDLKDEIEHYKNLQNAKRTYIAKCKYFKIKYSLVFYNMNDILFLNGKEEYIHFSEKKINLIKNVPYIVNIISDKNTIDLQIISEEYTHYIESNNRIKIIYNIHFPQVFSIIYTPNSTQAVNELTGRLCSFHEDNDINHLEVFDSSEAEYELSIGGVEVNTIRNENLEYLLYIGKNVSNDSV